MTTANQIRKAKLLSSQGEVRLVHGKKTLFLPCVEPGFKPKKRRKGRGQISRAYKNRT